MKKVRTLKTLSWVLFGFGIFLLILLTKTGFESYSIANRLYGGGPEQIKLWIASLPLGLVLMPFTFIGWYLLRRLGGKWKGGLDEVKRS